MVAMVLGRCTDCDSEYFFMDGSRCAACLSALQKNVEDTTGNQEHADIFLFDDGEEQAQLQRAA